MKYRPITSTHKCISLVCNKLCITSPIGLIQFPVGVSVASPALSSDRLCHDNVGYVKN